MVETKAACVFLNLANIVSFTQCENGVVNGTAILTDHRATIITLTDSTQYVVKGFVNPPLDAKFRFMEISRDRIISTVKASDLQPHTPKEPEQCLSHAFYA